MTLRVELASPDEKTVIQALLADYLSELGNYGEVDMAYRYFDLYWASEEQRWPYLIWRGQENIGFALVNTVSPSGKGTDFAMAEFYIVPQARRSGSGIEAAKIVFQSHPGQWELGIMPLNASAKRFWPKAIRASSAGAIEQMDTEIATIYRFSIGSASKVAML